MTGRENERWRCVECDTVMNTGAIIQFPDPEEEGNSWAICPNCRSAESFERLCDEPECPNTASCGTPVQDERRYVHTCYEHRP